MPPRTLYDVPAPGKLNLFLHVTGRRSDGYHLLQSVFVPIDWADTLHFERRQDGLITREDLNSDAPPLPDNDLIVRAAQALRQATGCPHGVHIGLDKQLPQQAGLGGGSSDAATTLIALNRLWDLRLPPPQLQQIGLTLGADVPFFLQGDAAWVEGIGEQLTPLTLPISHFVVLKPPTGVSTPDIFRHPQLKRDTKPITIRDLLAADAERIFEYGSNDLQTVAQALCPDIETGLHWLKQQNLCGRMTGSGSAVFARADNEVNLTSLPSSWKNKNCKNLVEHPLKNWKFRI